MATLILTEDQNMLATNAREVVEAEAPISRFRALRDRGEVFDAELWAHLTENGWPAMPFSEDDGGLGMGLAEVAIIMEALGRQMVSTPMLSAVYAARLDPSFGAQEGRVLALAWREDARDASPARCDTRVQDGRLTGTKLGVLDGQTAEAFVVSARDGDGIALFRVDASEVNVVPLTRVDRRDAANIHLVDAPAVRLPGGLAELEAALIDGTVVMASEALGAMEGAFALTKAFLHERKQFDVPIGSFQAVQHRMVDVFMQIELTRSAVLQAAREPTRAMAGLAATKTSETFLHVVKEATQLHGGIGVTDECDVGFYTKRAIVVARELGDGPITWWNSR